MKNEYNAVIIGLLFSALLVSIVLMIVKHFRESNWIVISILAFVLVCTTLYCNSYIAKFNALSKKIFSFILYVTLGGLGYIASTYFLDKNIDDDSARYMLSALIQSEAAILAIVVSLSLIIIQQAASSYSVRIVDAFKNKKSGLWMLTGIYLFAIIYGLAVLMLIETTDLENNKLDFEKHIKIAYYIGVVALFSLIPYMENMFDLLKPSTMFKMLSSEITMESILAIVNGESDEIDEFRENDPIQPIIDIMRSSLIKYDFDTLRDGLNAISSRTNLIIKGKSENKDKELLLSHVIPHLIRFGNLIVSRGDIYSTLYLLNNLRAIGICVIKQELKDAPSDVINAITTIGVEATHNDLIFPATLAKKMLEILDTEAKKHGLDYEVQLIEERIQKIEEALKVESTNKLA